MQNKKYKIVCQSIEILKSNSTAKILSCSTNFGNSIVVYTTHIDFNNNRINHDCNSSANSSHFTANGLYLMIWLKNPNALEIINVKNGEIFVARGIDDQGAKTIAVSLQPQQGLKAGRNSRKIYLILQQRGILGLKVVQIEPKIDNNPKTRSKILQQNTNQMENTIKALPIFSYSRWNSFILCRKQIMRVCRPVNRNNDIQFDFAIQAFQKNLTQLCSTFKIIGVAEGQKTWALLCGNSNFARNQNNITLNIFWQHSSPNDFARNMYCKDQAFIKIVQLPYSQKFFISLMHIDGFYLVQTRGRQNGSHLCSVIFEQNGSQPITLNLSDNSSICPFSLSVSSAQVSLCEINNQNQLNLVKLYEKQVQQQQQNFSQNQNQTQTQQRKNQTLVSDNNKIQQQSQQNIKKFHVIDENKTIVNDSIKNQGLNSTDGKNTTKKSDSTQQQQILQQTTNLLNKKLVQHLTKNQTNTINNSDDQIEVPDTLQNVVSFGTPGTGNKPTQVQKNANVNVSVVSFGAPSQIKSTDKQQKNTKLMSFGTSNQKNSPSINKSNLNDKNKKTAEQQNKINQKNQIKTLDKVKVKQIRESFGKLLHKISEELQQRQQSLKQNYSTIKFRQLINLQPPFSTKQQRTAKKAQQIIKNYDWQKRLSQYKSIQNNIKIKRNMEKINRISQIFSQYLKKLQISSKQQCLQLKLLRKSIKNSAPTKIIAIQQSLLQNSKQLQYRITNLQNNSDIMLKNYKQKPNPNKLIQQNKTKNNANKKIKYSFNSPFQKYDSDQKIIPIPFFQSIIIQYKEPLIDIKPL